MLRKLLDWMLRNGDKRSTHEGDFAGEAPQGESGDSDPTMDGATTPAFQDLDREASDPQYSIALALRVGDWDALRAEGADAVPVLATGAASGDTARRIQCVELLSETGAAAAASVVRALVDDDSRAATSLKRACIVGLGRFRDRGDIARLARMAHDQFSGPEALKRLELLKACSTALRTIDPDWGIAVDAGYAFMFAGTLPRQESVELRSAAIDLMGDVPGDEIEEYCASLLMDEEASVRLEAAAVLRRRSWVPESREAMAMIYAAERDYDQLLALAELAVAPLRALADLESIEVLVQINSDSARRALVGIVREGIDQRVADVSAAIQSRPQLDFLRPLVGCFTRHEAHSARKYDALADAMTAVVQASPVEARRRLEEIAEDASVRGRVAIGFVGHSVGEPLSMEWQSQVLAEYVADPNSHAAALSGMLLSTIGHTTELWPELDPSEPDSAPEHVLARWCRLASEALSYRSVRRDRHRSDIQLGMGDDATVQLCAESSVVATAVLKQICDMPDTKAYENTGPLGPPFCWVKFDTRRELARAELQRRRLDR